MSHTIKSDTLTSRLSGAWLVAKLRQLQREHGTRKAATIARKSFGLPLDLSLFIFSRGAK